MKKASIAACFLLMVGCSKAQVFGGNPPSIHWKQINTDTARIIFPEGIEKITRLRWVTKCVK